MKIGGKDAVIAFCRGGLLAVELETGRQLWKYDHRASILESVNAMMPIVNKDQIFVNVIKSEVFCCRWIHHPRT